MTTTTKADGTRWREVREALGISQREMADRINELDPELRMAATSISRYETGQRIPAPHIQGAYQVAAMLGGAPIPEQVGPKPHIDAVIGLIEAETIMAYCTGVLRGVETDPPPRELAEAILAMARGSFARLERETRGPWDDQEDPAPS